MDIDEVLLEAEEKMEKTLHVTQEEFLSIRTGKASPDLVSGLAVDVYGTHMKLRELAAITTPEARLIQVQPWDASSLDPIRKAIENSNIGINPMVDGRLIRLPIPELSTERRLELVKTIKSLAEEARVSVRGVRRHAIDMTKKLKKEGKITEDDLTSTEKEIQKLTDQHTKKIDEILEKKEAELMKV